MSTVANNKEASIVFANYLSARLLGPRQQRVFGHMWTVKAQISLRIRAAWSGPSLSTDRIFVQSNLNSSNNDGSFTIANSNSFWSPCEILPKQILGKFSYFVMNLYVVCTH